MKLTNLAFKEGGIIPSTYTCEGKNVNPPLVISDVPSGTKSLVLIMDDPDVPHTIRADGVWDHWLLFNIPPHTTTIDENSTPAECVEGKTTYGQTHYGGPCPPDREHRYFFKLYALDSLLPLKVGASKKEIEKAMQKHILAECKLMGKYEKGKGY